MNRRQVGIVAAAGLVFALLFGVRQSIALFIGPINTATGLGIASISLAFACAQLMWGITQPIAGAFADKYGTGRVIGTGAILVTLGTVLTPYASTTWMLVLLIGVRRRRRRRHGGPRGADVLGCARRARRETRPRKWHGQRGRLVRPVRRRAARRAPHRDTGLGRRADCARAAFTCHRAAGLGAARCPSVRRAGGALGEVDATRRA